MFDKLRNFRLHNKTLFINNYLSPSTKYVIHIKLEHGLILYQNPIMQKYDFQFSWKKVYSFFSHCLNDKSHENQKDNIVFASIFVTVWSYHIIRVFYSSNSIFFQSIQWAKSEIITLYQLGWELFSATRRGIFGDGDLSLKLQKT